MSPTYLTAEQLARLRKRDCPMWQVPVLLRRLA
jgi:hypothetical protein